MPLTGDSSRPAPGEPYCSACGYKLTGLTESARCPECGRPLVEVLTRGSMMLQSGKRWRTQATIFGLPVIDIAFGPKDGQMRGRARGFIAIGDIATGWLALGGIARGGVAIGGVAVGGFTISGVGVGLVSAVGGCAIGCVAAGGVALGGLAAGGGALGFIAQGGVAIGYYARGGVAFGVHTVPRFPVPAGTAPSPAQQVFDSFSWFFGSWPPGPLSAWQPMIACGLATLAAAGLLALGAALRLRAARPGAETLRAPR